MAYRVPADRDEAARVEAHELRAIEQDAQRRTRRAYLMTFAALAGGAALLFVGFACDGKSRRILCHEVQIRWENAPHVPPSTYTSCRTVEM